jgi:hypothetical protein
LVDIHYSKASAGYRQKTLPALEAEAQNGLKAALGPTVRYPSSINAGPRVGGAMSLREQVHAYIAKLEQHLRWNLIQWDQKIPHLPNRNGGDMYGNPSIPGGAVLQDARRLCRFYGMPATEDFTAYVEAITAFLQALTAFRVGTAAASQKVAESFP